MHSFTTVKHAYKTVNSYLESLSCWRKETKTTKKRENIISKGITFIISTYKHIFQIRHLSFTAVEGTPFNKSLSAQKATQL